LRGPTSCGYSWKLARGGEHMPATTLSGNELLSQMSLERSYRIRVHGVGSLELEESIYQLCHF